TSSRRRGQPTAVESLATEPLADEYSHELDELGESLGFDGLDEAEDWEEDEDVQAQIEWQRCVAAFTELRGELTAQESREYVRRLEGRRVDALRPRDPAEARAKLLGIVEKAVTRREGKREVDEQ